MTSNRLPEPEVPAACRPTLQRLQGALDGVLPLTALDPDAHVESCPSCRDRIALSRLVFPALPRPVVTAMPSAALIDQILLSAERERRAVPAARFRRRLTAAVGALAACLLVAVGFGWNPTHWKTDTVQTTLPGTETPPAGPAANAVEPPPGPAVPPLRLGEELSKAETAFLNSSRPITEPARAAPVLLSRLSDALASTATAPAEVGFSGQSLGGIPDAARTGFEPVTETTRRAFARLMSDISGIQTKPMME